MVHVRPTEHHATARALYLGSQTVKGRRKLLTICPIEEYAKTLADGMFGYEKLIKKHGYNLKTKEALLDYYALVSLENLYENDFTDEELVALLQ